MNFVADIRPVPLLCFSCKMSGNSFLYIDRLANIDHIPFRVVEIVNTSLGWQFLKFLFGQVGWKNCFTRVSFQRFQNNTLGVTLQKNVEDLCGSFCISASAVTIWDRDTKAFGESSQAVRVKTRDNLPAQSHRAEFLGAPLDPCFIEFLLQEAVIKVRIMSHKDAIF